MEAREKVLSPQERRIEKREEESLTTERAKIARARVNKMLKGFRDQPPRVAVERASLMVESLKETEGLPIVLRWAKALENVMANIEVHIGPNELIVGRAGPPGRYGLLYPELRGTWLEKNLDSLMKRKEGAFVFTKEDARIIREEIVPYWKGRTVF
jgi:formate C-acetyltransferase